MTRIHRSLIAILLTLFALALTHPAPAAEDDAGWTKLFNGTDLTGWTRYLTPTAKDADPDKVWTVKHGVIVCAGNPTGYLLTEKEYDNYVLRLQWRWGAAPARGGRNSGVFVHVVGPDKIWPKGIEAQLMADHAGDFWLVDGAKLTIDRARQDKNTPRHYLRTKDGVEKPVGQWNQYEITCRADSIKLVVNRQFVNEGTASDPARGRILLQSEGAPIEFRNIELKPLR